MIRDSEELRRFEAALVAREKPDFEKNLRIVEALHREAVSLGVFPPKDPLDGIEVDIRIARVVNSVQSGP